MFIMIFRTNSNLFSELQIITSAFVTSNIRKYRPILYVYKLFLYVKLDEQGSYPLRHHKKTTSIHKITQNWPKQDWIIV